MIACDLFDPRLWKQQLEAYRADGIYLIPAKLRALKQVYEREREPEKQTNRHIRLIPFGTMPLNQLLMSCHMLITDYSSVSWDVYYQEKPVIFYPPLPWLAVSQSKAFPAGFPRQKGRYTAQTCAPTGTAESFPAGPY